MNNSINYTGYADMVLDSSDDFEPYGCGNMFNFAADARASGEINHSLHRDSMVDEPWWD